MHTLPAMLRFRMFAIARGFDARYIVTSPRSRGARSRPCRMAASIRVRGSGTACGPIFASANAS